MNNKNQTFSSVITRSQIIKNNEKIISDYEIQIKKLEKENKSKDTLLQNLQKKLMESEKSRQDLLEEIEQSSAEFEKLCSDNALLKRKLAGKDIKICDLEDELVNVSKLNNTLIQENEDVSNVNLILTPLHKQLSNLTNEKQALQNQCEKLKLDQSILLADIQKRNEKSLPSTYIKRCKIINNRKLNKKLRSQKKKCKKLQNRHGEIVKQVEKLKKCIIKLKNKTEEKHEKSEESQTLSKFETIIIDNSCNMQEFAKVETLKYEKQNLFVIGDDIASGLGGLLTNKCEENYNILCNSYPNASLNIILQNASTLINNIKDGPSILTIVINNLKQENLKTYFNGIVDLQNKARRKGVKLIVTNIKYEHDESGSKVNNFIHKINTKLQQISFYDNVITLIDLNTIDRKITKLKRKSLICDAIKQHSANIFLKAQSEARNPSDQQMTKENFLTGQNQDVNP